MKRYYTDLTKLVEVYTNTSSVSSNWSSVYNSVCSLSSNWSEVTYFSGTYSTNFLFFIPSNRFVRGQISWLGSLNQTLTAVLPKGRSGGNSDPFGARGGDIVEILDFNPSVSSVTFQTYELFGGGWSIEPTKIIYQASPNLYTQTLRFVFNTINGWQLEKNSDKYKHNGLDPIRPLSILALPLSGGTLTGNLNTPSIISNFYNNLPIRYVAPFNLIIGQGFGPNSITAPDIATSGNGRNTIIGGMNAGYPLTTGTENVLIGTDAGRELTSGSRNLALGTYALGGNVLGSNNIGIGIAAGSLNLGDDNIFVGNNSNANSGFIPLSSYRNIIIGQNSNAGGFNDTIVIGRNIQATESGQILLSSINGVFRTNSSTFNIGSVNTPNNLTVFGNVSSNNFIYGNNLTIQQKISSQESISNSLSSQTVKISNILFTGKSTMAASLTGDNLFVEVIVGNQKKYLQLFDIELPLLVYTIDFESATKGTYDPANINLNGLLWYFNNTLVGTLAGDYKEGLKSARLRGYANSEMRMVESKPTGIGNISFKYRAYTGDTIQIQWLVQYSMDAGLNWTTCGTFTATDIVQTFSTTVNQAGNGRIRIIANTALPDANRRTNVDDIVITEFL